MHPLIRKFFEDQGDIEEIEYKEFYIYTSNSRQFKINPLAKIYKDKLIPPIYWLDGLLPIQSSTEEILRIIKLKAFI